MVNWQACQDSGDDGFQLILMAVVQHRKVIKQRVCTSMITERRHANYFTNRTEKVLKRK